MIERIEPVGPVVRGCTIPGETRADDVFAAHPNGVQLSKRRFAIVYATRGWRGVDDDRSIVVQIRDGSYTGPVIRERCLQPSREDWQPLEDGRNFIKQHGSPVAFGVAKGAVTGGRTPAHAGLFAVKWRRIARMIDPATGFMAKFTAIHEQVEAPTQAVEWAQFRLNDAEDDIEIVQPAMLFRQRGYGQGYTFCERRAWHMNQSFVQPVTFTADGTEWIDANQFDDDGSVAFLRHAYNPRKDLYEWVQTGPLIAGMRFEPAVARHGEDWVLCTRSHWKDRVTGQAVWWGRVHDPFSETPKMVYGPNVQSGIPRTAYRCADGVLRLFTTDRWAMACNSGRDPLMMWDIDPEQGFAGSNLRVVFDTKKAGVPFREGCARIADMPKLMPHAGGSGQTLLFRVRPGYTNNPGDHGERVNEAEKGASGIYAVDVVYSQEYPGRWSFEQAKT